MNNDTTWEERLKDLWLREGGKYLINIEYFIRSEIERARQEGINIGSGGRIENVAFKMMKHREEEIRESYRKDLVEKLKAMRDRNWVLHGIDCKEGRRPCGITREKLADRCEEQVEIDEYTLNKVLSLINEK